MKRYRILVIICILSLIICACGNNKQTENTTAGSANDNVTESTQDTIEQDEPTANDPINTDINETDYAAAYKMYAQLLEENIGTINEHDTSFFDYRKSSFVAFADIYGDDLPEMIFLKSKGASSSYFADLEIVTYKDDSIVSLYSYDGFHTGAAGGGGQYYLFKVKEEKSLYIMWSAGDEWSLKKYFKLVENSSGTLSENELLYSYWSLVVSSSSEADEYRVNGEPASGDQYRAQEAMLLEKITDVMICNNNLAAAANKAAENSLTSYYANTDWTALIRKDKSATYEEAIHNLNLAIGIMEGSDIQRKFDVGMLRMLNRFLANFNYRYWDVNKGKEYDNTKASDGSSNILSQIVKLAPCVNYSIYPGNGMEQFWNAEKDDPLGRYASDHSYAKFDGASVKWIAENIFNITDDDFNTLEQQCEADDVFYRYDNNDGTYDYYCWLGGIGEGVAIVVTDIQADGNKLNVIYTDYYDTGTVTDFRTLSDNPTYHYATFELKTIDGEQYWSLYKHTADVPEPKWTAASNLLSEIAGEYVWPIREDASSRIIISADGSFVGQDTSSGWFVSDYSGKLTNPRRMDRYTYCFNVSDFKYETEPGTEKTEGNITYTYTTTAHFADDDEIYLYTKDTPLFMLPDSVKKWGTFPYSYDDSINFSQYNWIVSSGTAYWMDQSDYFETTFTSSSGNIGNATVSLKKGFDFIDTDSSQGNWELAVTAITLSAQIYNNAKGNKTKDILYKLGYDVAEVQNGDSSFAHPRVCFGYKQLDNGKNLFVAIVRGTDGGADIWTDVQDGALSMFRVSGEYIEIQLEDFMKTATGKTKDKLQEEDNYFFFAGHSLGGAVANYLSINEEIQRFVHSDKGKIYTYTFESPHTCEHLLWNDPESESNAFNFKVYDDAVTNVPPYPNSTTYGKDIPIEVSDLDDELFRRLFPDSKSSTLADATSVTGHGDRWGLHDVCLSFIYIMQNLHHSSGGGVGGGGGSGR